MESTVAHSNHPAWWLEAYKWADARKKELAYGCVAVVLAGLVVSFFIYHRLQREVAAGRALSQVAAATLEPGSRGDKPGGYLKVASEYSGTSAAGQALLLAAAAYFSDGKYAEGQKHYERFIRDYRESPLLGQALFGVAACLDAQGKAADAADRYKNLMDRRPNDSMIPQARLNLGRIYEAQNKPELAKPLYLEVARNAPYSAAGSEAGMRLEALLTKHPELAEQSKASATTNAPVINLGTP